MLAAQLLISLGQGVGVGMIAALLAGVTQAALGRHGLPAATIVSADVGSTAAAAPCGLPGAAVGVILRNPALAACAIVLWSYTAEPFISTLSYRAYIYLPGGARKSLVHHHSAHHHIPPPPTGGLILAGWAAAAALAFTRRDAA